MQTERGKISYLDGIRGLAALVVFFHHFFLAFYSAYYTGDIAAEHLHGFEARYGKSPFSVLTNGNFAVAIFFVLSGYVLSRRYFQTNAFPTLISGAHRRFLRLYIPVAFTLIISYILIKAHLFYNVSASVAAHSEWWFGGLWVMEYPTRKLLSCLLYRTMFFGDSIFDTCMWSLSLEYFGSLFVFAFLALTHHTKNRLFYLILVFLFTCATARPWLCAFAFGIGLNYAEQYRTTLKKPLITFLSISLMIIAVVLGSYPSNGEVSGTIFESKLLAGHVIYEWAHLAGAGFFVLAFVLSLSLQKLINMRFCRFLGYISFSLYLLHPIIIGSFSSYLFLEMNKYYGYNYSVAIVCVATIGFSFIASALMARYIDAFGVRLAKRVFTRYAVKNASLQNAE